MRSCIWLGLVAVVAVWAGPVAADCICLNKGVEVTEGNTACIKTANGGQLALCEKNLNVTNWKFLGEACPVADAENSFRESQHIAIRLK